MYLEEIEKTTPIKRELKSSPSFLKFYKNKREKSMEIYSRSFLKYINDIFVQSTDKKHRDSGRYKMSFFWSWVCFYLNNIKRLLFFFCLWYILTQSRASRSETVWLCNTVITRHNSKFAGNEKEEIDRRAEQNGRFYDIYRSRSLKI